MPAPGPVPTLGDHVERAWIDELVTLQVLAAHGDLAAAVRAEEWIAHDPQAHEQWITIAETCRQVRPGGLDT